MLTNHGYAMIGDPRTTWGVTDGNPIWEEMREAARLIEPLFLLNVSLNNAGEISGVFRRRRDRGAPARGCTFVRDSAMVTVAELFDAVATTNTNSGYPLEQNLYQTVKGMQAAKGIVRASGIIMAATRNCSPKPAHRRRCLNCCSGRGSRPRISGRCRSRR